ncbi:oxidoreductase [Psychrobacillus sp. Sa2BUA9]|uniref:Oxidoreductase n=1 Tax=Psychrobacillus faecigallinarum TaxID=2762235 RepID=A0ABR8RBD0_9BACI|nr:oxidoreductase [Psychrobacillus faecigallinarum]MBD7945094.1 oxidoreductase [Psychrobacillus faecigallinarum]
MKKIIIGTACIMIVGIFVGTLFYENLDAIPTDSKQNNITTLEQTKPLQPFYVDDLTGYSLENDQVQITFNSGNEWIEVPIEKEKLFEGEYSGSKTELIDDSYILSQGHAYFLYSNENDSNETSIELLYTKNEGKTWGNIVVVDRYPLIRFRKVEFLNDSFGYVIISGDRTMSQEWTNVYITKDGGMQWKEATHSNITRLISDGGFVSEEIGFLSFGILNPEEPDLHVTQDGGASWREANINIPEKYNKIFVLAEVPFKEDDYLAVYINQGPNGDYQGGKVKGKFISNDNGKTWEFLMEVTPNEPKI